MHVSAGEIARQRPDPLGYLVKRWAAVVFDRLKRSSRPRPATPSQSELEVLSVDPEEGIRLEQLLAVAASVVSLDGDPVERAIARNAASLGLPLSTPEDLRRLPSGALHCWVEGVPILLGPREVLSILGIRVGETERCSGSSTEIFVAQGSRLLGRIVISGL